jgi:sulfofructose kinase
LLLQKYNYKSFIAVKVSEVFKVDVVGVGLNATDTLIQVPRYPASGSKVDSLSINVLPGGQVATAMIACQSWGMRTRYVGKLGDDMAAELHRKEFSRSAVEAQIITVGGCHSPQSFIIVDPQGERTVLWERDERLVLQPEELKREWIVNARALLVDGCDTSAAITAAAWAHEAGIPVIADLDAAYPDVEALMSSIDFLIVSRDFPERVVGEARLEKSLPLIKDRYGCKLTAATLGAGGVLAWDGERFHHASAYRVPVVDSTGAGDIFHAGFIYGLLQDWPLQRQLDLACAAAGLNCTGVGARGGIRSIDEIEKLMETGTRYPGSFDI